MKARTLAIARGDYKPTVGEPKVWFTSAESFARVLSDRNRALLGIIAESGPDSLTRLAELTGRKKSNLSRTLKTMERYGFVQLRHGARGSIVPRVRYGKISLTLPLARNHEPEVLRLIGEESKRSGTNKLTSRRIDQVIKVARQDKRRSLLS
jgi:predicted transcriptional regulator